MPLRHLVVLSLAMAQLACSPTLDWRLVRPPDWPLSLELPCRPSEQTRQVALASATVAMKVLACSAGEQLYAVGSADVVDPAQVGPALSALAQAAQRNVAGRLLDTAPAAVRGMTPHPAASMARLVGQGSQGQALQLRYVVFVHGTRVFQATVLGSQAHEAASSPLFDSLQLRP